jgi:hypothetical protein
MEYVEGHPTPTTDSLAFGRTVHRVVEICTNDDTTPDDLDGVELFDHDGLSLGRVALTSAHRTASRRLLGNMPAGVQWSTEVQFVDEVIAFPAEVRGTMDAVGLDRDTLHIIDHKTTAGLQWATTTEEIPTHFQALLYVAHAASAHRHPGPVRFSFNVVEKRHPFRSELRSHTFDREAVGVARRFVARVVGEMSADAVAPLGSVSYNLDACRDYTSKNNPDGCPFRRQCAGLGRPTMGPNSILFNDNDNEDQTMDQLSNLLRKTREAPALNGRKNRRSLDELRAIVGEDVDPPADQIDNLRRSAEQERSALVHEIVTMNAGATEAERTEWMSATIPALREVRSGLIKFAPVHTLDRAEVIAQLQTFHALTEADAEPYSDDQLRTALKQLRAEAAVGDHAINAPEAVAQDLDLDAVEAVAPKKRGRKPTAPTITVDGVEHRLTRATRDVLFAWLRQNNVEPPNGRGSVTRARNMIADMLAGGTPPQQSTLETPTPTEATPAEPEPAEPTPAEPVVPQSAELDTVLDEIHRRRGQLGIGPWQFSRPGHSLPATNENIRAAVEHVNELRERCDVMEPEPVSYTPPTVAAEPDDGFLLCVNCRPDSGTNREIDALVAKFGAALAAKSQAPHYLAMNYNEGPRKVASMLHGAIASGAVTLTGAVYVSTRSSMGSALVDILTPLARDIIRGDA